MQQRLALLQRYSDTHIHVEADQILTSHLTGEATGDGVQQPTVIAA